MKKMKPFGNNNNNNNFKTMFDSEGNMHMISGEGDIKYDSFTGRFFNDPGSGGLKQDPVTGDMWFDNGILWNTSTGTENKNITSHNVCYHDNDLPFLY